MGTTKTEHLFLLCHEVQWFVQALIDRPSFHKQLWEKVHWESYDNNKNKQNKNCDVMFIVICSVISFIFFYKRISIHDKII